jgi:hypothetical protein
MLIPIIISQRRCQSKAHGTQPSRTPDARSVKASEPERFGAFPPRSREATILGIAHQVKPEWQAAERVEDTGISEKILMALCRASIRPPFPTSLEKCRATRNDRCT